MVVRGTGAWVELNLTPELHRALRKRSKELGYGTLSQYMRCIVSRELREPRIPSALILLGRKPRKMGLSRPKH